MASSSFTSKVSLITQFLGSSSHQKPQKQVFKKRRIIEGAAGVLSLIEGRVEPRAVRTWVYSPKRYDLNATKAVTTKVYKDLHLYLDLLGPLPHSNTPQANATRSNYQLKRKQGQSVDTHRLCILKTNHFPDRDGFYDDEIIFWKDCDFYLSAAMAPNRAASAVVDQLAKGCLLIADPLKLSEAEWNAQIDSIWQELKAYYHHQKRDAMR